MKTKTRTLTLNNIHVSISDTRVLRGISLDIREGETHIIMGPNGSGKSTLLSTIMGDPKCSITKGSISLDTQRITHLAPDVRARAGIFLAFQQPPEVPGVTIGNFLRRATQTTAASDDPGHPHISPIDFAKKIRPEFARVGLDPSFLGRSLNEGFSGGERKKSEILQMIVLNPAFAFLDEIDSGLDIDAVKIILTTLAEVQKKNGCAVVIVTHNPAILEHIRPNKIHILSQGRIVASDGAALAKKVIKNGFEYFTH